MNALNNSQEIKDLYTLLGSLDQKIAAVKDSVDWSKGSKSAHVVSDRLVAVRHSMFKSLSELESLHGKPLEDVEPFEFDLDDLSVQA